MFCNIYIVNKKAKIYKGNVFLRGLMKLNEIHPIMLQAYINSGVQGRVFA